MLWSKIVQNSVENVKKSAKNQVFSMKNGLFNSMFETL